MVTILIPSYNHEDYILECLREAIKVDIPSREIIIIDDGSTDKTAELVQDFIEECHSESKITLVRKQHSGLVSSLNLGLTMTTTEYFYCIASDDIPIPLGIEEAVRYLEQRPNLYFLIAGGENFFEDGTTTPIYTAKHTRFFDLPVQKRNQELFLNFPQPILLQSTVFRTDALKETGGWNSGLEWDDYPMFVKLLMYYPERGRHFEFLPTILVVKYRHYNSNSYKNLEKQFFMVKQGFEYLAPQHLKNKAIGYNLGYYALKALTLFQPRIAISLVLSSPVATWGWAIIGMFRVTLRKIWTIMK